MLPALDPHSLAPKMALKKCPLASSHVCVSARKFQTPGYCEDASVTKLQVTHSQRVWKLHDAQLQSVNKAPGATPWVRVNSNW